MIGTVPAQTDVISRMVVVVAEAKLVVSEVVVAVACQQLSPAVALESRARDHIEDAVSPVAGLSRKAAALHFDIIDVLGIELRAHVAGDIGIRHRDSIDGPSYLVSSADVKLIVHHY